MVAQQIGRHFSLYVQLDYKGKRELNREQREPRMASTRHSIRRRLMTMMMLTSAASIALMSGGFIVYEFLAARDESLREIQTLARVVAANSTAALAFRAEDDAHEVLATLRTESQIVAAALYDENGRLFAVYPRVARSSVPTAPSAGGFDFTADVLEGFQTVSEKPERPLGALFVRADMQPVYDRFGLYALVAAAGTLASLLLAYVLSRFFQRSLLRPIHSLVDTARAVAERDDYAARAPASDEAELGVLTSAFNHMLERIAQQSSALRESEARLRAVLNSALSAVIVMDARGDVVDWNTQAEKIFGWSRAEALGAHLADMIIPERLRQAHRTGIERFLATGQTTILDRTLELPGLRRDGVEFPIELSVSALRTDAQPTFCGFATDITERKQARARTQAHLARLDLLQRTTRAIAERQDLGSIYRVILTRLEEDMPVDFGCLCEYDEAGGALTVVSIGSASGAHAESLQLRTGVRLPADEASLARCVSGALVYEPDTREIPYTFAQRFATAGLCSLVAAPLIVESRIFGVLLVARASVGAFSSADCEFLRQLSEHVALAAHQVQLHTALQRAYDELRQSQQVILQQERLRALGQMASGVAHDINNAISPIALYTESILEREPNLSERAREQLGIVQRAIGDVSQTVAKMREFYRPRDGSDLRPIELNPLVEQALQSTRARWHDMPQERGVVIAARAELDAEGTIILGAQSDIRDALTNLIFNAVDAMPEGGALTVRTRRSGARGKEASDRVELEVVDSGVGMDEETKRRCLEPFFTTKGERGTGMGLAMVYGMARRHGAELEIDSAPGAGSTVRLRFRAAAQSALRKAAAPSQDATRRLRILLVDDDPLVLESLLRTLSADGHDVSAAEGGQAGVERFGAAQRESAEFDVVITDLGMPYVDGRAVAAAVKSAAPQTPVLLLTGWGERLQAEHNIPANVDRVLSKPPRMTELRGALVELTTAVPAREEYAVATRRVER
jgi:PAS domain S-box-containing protein